MIGMGCRWKFEWLKIRTSENLINIWNSPTKGDDKGRANDLEHKADKAPLPCSSKASARVPITTPPVVGRVSDDEIRVSGVATLPEWHGRARAAGPVKNPVPRAGPLLTHEVG